MQFYLFLSLVCYFMSSTDGCKEIPSGIPQVDQHLHDENALGEAGVMEADVRVMLNKLLTEGLSQLMSNGNLNFEGFRQKTAEILSNPRYVSLLEEASLTEGGECDSCGAIQSDTCDGSIGLEASCNDVGESCMSLT